MILLALDLFPSRVVHPRSAAAGNSSEGHQTRVAHPRTTLLVLKLAPLAALELAARSGPRSVPLAALQLATLLVLKAAPRVLDDAVQQAGRVLDEDVQQGSAHEHRGQAA